MGLCIPEAQRLERVFGPDAVLASQGHQEGFLVHSQHAQLALYEMNLQLILPTRQSDGLPTPLVRQHPLPSATCGSGLPLETRRVSSPMNTDR